MASCTRPILLIRADWTASGACTSGLTVPREGATRRASGGVATTSTASAERSLALPQGRVDHRVHHPAHHRLGLAIGGAADVLEDDHRLDAIDDRQRFQEPSIRARLQLLSQRAQRGGEDLGPLPATERLL